MNSNDIKERKLINIILLILIVFASVFKYVLLMQPREIKISSYEYFLPMITAPAVCLVFIWAFIKQTKHINLLSSILLGALLGGSITFFLFCQIPLILKMRYFPAIGVILAPHSFVFGALIGLTYWFSYRQKNINARQNFILNTIVLSFIFIIASILTLVNG